MVLVYCFFVSGEVTIREFFWGKENEKPIVFSFLPYFPIPPQLIAIVGTIIPLK
jgi:hypothetical protein